MQTTERTKMRTTGPAAIAGATVPALVLTDHQGDRLVAIQGRKGTGIVGVYPSHLDPTEMANVAGVIVTPGQLRELADVIERGELLP